MFSTAVEVVLHIAFREAVSRRHAYLTLEHLLYALAHDPDGERILGACGVDLGALRRNLSKYLDDSIEQVARGQEREPEQTVAFRRVLQSAILHVQSAQRQEAQVGDILAAILQQPKTHAAAMLADLTQMARLSAVDRAVEAHAFALRGDLFPHPAGHGVAGSSPLAATAPAFPRSRRWATPRHRPTRTRRGTVRATGRSPSR